MLLFIYSKKEITNSADADSATVELSQSKLVFVLFKDVVLTLFVVLAVFVVVVVTTVVP